MHKVPSRLSVNFDFLINQKKSNFVQITEEVDQVTETGRGLDLGGVVEVKGCWVADSGRQRGTLVADRRPAAPLLALLPSCLPACLPFLPCLLACLPACLPSSSPLALALPRSLFHALTPSLRRFLRRFLACSLARPPPHPPSPLAPPPLNPLLLSPPRHPPLLPPPFGLLPHFGLVEPKRRRENRTDQTAEARENSIEPRNSTLAPRRETRLRGST